MGYNSVVLGFPKPIGIQRVDGLSRDPWKLGCHTCKLIIKITFITLINSFEHDYAFFSLTCRGA